MVTNPTIKLQAPRLLILDEDAKLRSMLRQYLGQFGFLAYEVNSPAELNRALEHEDYDLLMMDVVMLAEDGLVFLRRLREEGHTIPVVILSARGDLIDRLLGLQQGADGYLVKPFEPRELLAKVEAILRRVRITQQHSIAQLKSIRLGTTSIDLEGRRVHRDGEVIELSTREFELLKVFLKHQNRPLSRARLMALSQGVDSESSERTIDVQVLRLRKIIETDPSKPRYLRTVWGSGYIFVPDKN